MNRIDPFLAVFGRVFIVDAFLLNGVGQDGVGFVELEDVLQPASEVEDRPFPKTLPGDRLYEHTVI
jgi:hypothetical protein